MSRVVGLLVGVNEYLGGIPSLRGCRHDIEHAREVLSRRAKAMGMDADFTVLIDAQATRTAVVETFRSTFREAGAGDVAVFYFAGHGSQQEVPPEHLAFEPDGLDETIVMHDSRADGGLDMADNELGTLVREVVSRGANMFVVLDCCHSGSGLRVIADTTTGARRVPTARGRRSLDSYLTPSDQVRQSATGGRLGADGYVLLAACRSNQTAGEVVTDEGQSRGVLSVALEAALTSLAGPTTYLQLHRAVAVAVEGMVSGQTPVLECQPSGEADRLVLGGLGREGVPLHVATFGSDGWRIDAGALHGLPFSPLGDQVVHVTLHPLAVDDLSDATRVARGHVTAVRSTSCDLAIDEGQQDLDPKGSYRIVIRDLPAAAVTVMVDTSVPDRDTVVGALTKVHTLSVVNEATIVDLVVTATKDQVCLTRPGATRPLVAARPVAEALTPAGLAALSDEATHVGRWLALLRRVNPTTRLAPTDVTLDLLDSADRPIAADPDGAIRLVYSCDDPALARIRVTNRSPHRLFVSVLALSDLYGVQTLFDGEGEWLEPATSVYVPAQDGTPDLSFTVPDGEQMTTDVLTVLAATQEFTSTPCRLPDLVPPQPLAPIRTLSGERSRGVSTVPLPRPPERAEDWTAVRLQVTTVRPWRLIPLRPGEDSRVEGGITLQAPAGFTASARVAAGVEAGRDALAPLLPSLLVDDPESLPFSLLPVRSDSGAVDVLELHAIDGPAAVSRNDPLVLRSPQSLAAGEVVLPIMFDGEDYLPVGFGVRDPADPSGGTLIRITRLPTREETAQRALGGAAKILFRTVVAHRLGSVSHWPQLSLISYDDGGQPHVEHDPAVVRARLRQARSALLLIHGVIGDMTGPVVGVGPAGAGLHRHWDAVLTLDYDTLDTSIEGSGSDLASALARVGVQPGGDGPRLTIVGHSMGGLVARCFVECQGGAAVTERLVTCGTPHQGSPWPRVQDAVTAALGLLLNVPLAVGKPGAAVGSALAFLARAAERLDTALDEMRPGSDLLSSLAGAADPGVPYTTLRGTRPWAADPDEGGGVGERASRIVHKLTGTSLDLVFAGEPNDLAVSVSSAAGVGSVWASRRPPTVDVECGHLSLLSSPAGIQALAGALGA